MRKKAGRKAFDVFESVIEMDHRMSNVSIKSSPSPKAPTFAKTSAQLKPVGYSTLRQAKEGSLVNLA